MTKKRIAEVLAGKYVDLEGEMKYLTGVREMLTQANSDMDLLLYLDTIMESRTSRMELLEETARDLHISELMWKDAIKRIYLAM